MIGSIPAQPTLLWKEGKKATQQLAPPLTNKHSWLLQANACNSPIFYEMRQSKTPVAPPLVPRRARPCAWCACLHRFFLVDAQQDQINQTQHTYVPAGLASTLCPHRERWILVWYSTCFGQPWLCRYSLSPSFFSPFENWNGTLQIYSRGEELRGGSIVKWVNIWKAGKRRGKPTIHVHKQKVYPPKYLRGYPSPQSCDVSPALAQKGKQSSPYKFERRSSPRGVLSQRAQRAQDSRPIWAVPLPTPCFFFTVTVPSGSNM
jgi:hypothetical protein